MGLPVQINYLRATEEFIPEIVKMHKLYIAGEDLWEFQDIFLGHYYHNIINSNDFVFIAEVENSLIGFCSLVKNQRNSLLHIIQHNYSELFKIPLNYWFPVLLYIYRNVKFEVFGGKWSNRAVSNYRSCAELRAIAVDPEYRKLQVGTNLLQTCIGAARKTKKMPLIAWVSEKNEPSIRLFIKNGFQKVAVSKVNLENMYLFYLKS